MGQTPDVTSAIAAVVTLHEQITDAYRRATTEGDAPGIERADAAAWSEVAGQLVEMDAQVRWMRDASLVIARKAGAPWAWLQHDTGVPDATLSNRRRRLEKDQ